jgi:histone H3/H4
MATQTQAAQQINLSEKEDHAHSAKLTKNTKTKISMSKTDMIQQAKKFVAGSAKKEAPKSKRSRRRRISKGIHPTTFCNIVMQEMKKVGCTQKQFVVPALQLFHVYISGKLEELFENAERFAAHANRKTIMEQDIERAAEFILR